MTVTEATKILRNYYKISNPSEEDDFTYTEALSFLIHELKKPENMMELGGFYYEKRNFELALKYYEMAAEYGFEDADECLGYIWYYGRTGERDYEKAFKYYSKAAEKGNIVCCYKVADMYKNGYYVEKDYEKYKEIIEELYPSIKDARSLGQPLPEIFTRLARIRMEEKRYEEAVNLFYEAKYFLAQRISYSDFFGNLNIMKWLIEDLYRLVEIESVDYDFYDLYELLKKPVRVAFSYEKKGYVVEAVEEDGACVISFRGKWYRTVDDFFAKACIGNNKLTAIFDELYDFEIITEN